MSQYYELNAAGDLPLTVKQVKGYLKLGEKQHPDDDLLALFLAAAVDYAEKYIGRELRANTWILRLDEFVPVRICLARDPIDTISEVARLVSDTFTAVATSVYYLKPNVQASEILLLPDQVWPVDQDVGIEHAIRITFVTKSHRCLDQAKLGILRHVAYLYENRGDCDPKDSNAVELSGAKFLYDQIRITRV